MATQSHRVTVDKAGLFYFTHYETLGSVFVFEPSAEFVKSMGDIHAANEHGIDIRDEDGTECLYLSPGNSNLSFTKMTMEGEVVWRKGKKLLDELSGNMQRSRVIVLPTLVFRVTMVTGAISFTNSTRTINMCVPSAVEVMTLDSFAHRTGNELDIRDGIPKLAVCDRANKRLQWFAAAGEAL